MIGSGSAAPARSACAGGRLRRSIANTANGTKSTRKSRARPGRRGLCDAGVQARTTAADGRFSTGTSAAAESTRAEVRSTPVLDRWPRPTSGRRLLEPRAIRPSGWPARVPAKIVAIGSAGCPRHTTQAAGPVATRVLLKTCDAGSTSSTSAMRVAGSGSTAPLGATSTGVSIAAGALASAAGAGAPGSSVAPGETAGSSSAGIPAVGSSSYDGRGVADAAGAAAGEVTVGDWAMGGAATGGTAGDSTGGKGSCATAAGTPRSGALGTAVIGCSRGGAAGAA